MTSNTTSSRFLVYPPSKAETDRREMPEDLRARVLQLGSAAGLVLQDVEDMTVIQGEPCLALQVFGAAEAVAHLVSTWLELGFRVLPSELEIHELSSRLPGEREGEQ